MSSTRLHVASVLLACAAATTTVFIPPLSVELHGFNDIGAWLQLLTKGVHWVKTDWSFCTQSSCENFSTFGQPGRGSTSDCFTNSDGSTLCCVCMRGDASSRPELTSPFNTSYDVLAFFNSTQHPALLPSPTDDTHFMLGMDWGGPSVDLLSGPASPFLQTFFLTLHSIITTRGLRVRPYFDAGTSGWFQALDVLCAAGSCSPTQLQLQAIPWPSDAGDALPMSGDPYGRFQIMNSDQFDLSSDCNTSSWNVSLSKAAAYPYLWYEPSSQIEYVGFIDSWLACPTTPQDKRDVSTGITVVSNLASEMFETYASPVIHRGVNSIFLPSSAYSSPRMALINVQSAAYPTYDRFTVVTAQYVNGTSSAVPVLVLCGIVDGTAPNASDILAQMPLQLLATVVTLSVYDAGVPLLHPLVLVGDDTGAITVYVFNASAAVTSPGDLLTRMPVTWDALSSKRMASVAPSMLSATWCCSPLVSNVNGCLLAALIQDGTNTSLTLLGVSAWQTTLTAVAEATVQSVLPILTGSVSLSVAAVNVTQLYNQERQLQEVPVTMQMQGVIAYSSGESASSRSLLYAAYAEVNMTIFAGALYNVTLVVENDGAAGNGSLTPGRLGFGSAPHVHTVSFNGTVYALVVNTDGLCQCGLLQNNDDTPHCLLATPAADDNIFLQQYQSVQYLLNYNYADIASFRAAAAAPLQNPFSFCSRRILSGKFENGLWPTAALYSRLVVHTPNSTTLPTDAAPSAELSALFMHDGDVVCPIITTIVCGSPLPKAGLVFDQFELVQPAALQAMQAAATVDM